MFLVDRKLEEQCAQTEAGTKRVDDSKSAVFLRHCDGFDGLMMALST